MTSSYYILAKKSIFGLMAGLFLFLAVPVSAAALNDQGYSYQQAMWAQINAPEAWQTTTGSPDTVVAVIDIGVNYNHPDLAGNIWTNSDEIADNGIDDDQNGYIDDVRGWNFIENNNDPQVIDSNNNIVDEETLSHGTAIAGLIGAIGNNNVFGAGLNWKIKIMPIRAIDNYGSGVYETITKAINYAVDNGADIINISFVGNANDEDLSYALRRAYDRGIMVTVAAGNNRVIGKGDENESPNYPICFDREDSENWLIGVTSVDSADRLSDFANYGTCVDLSAPGENIYSIQRVSYENGHNVFSGPWQGTSFSAPLVAGTAALVKSVRPEWTARDIISVLLSSSDDVDAKNSGFAGQMGYGRLNVASAVARAATEEHASGDLNRICYYKSTKLYCYDAEGEKNIYLANAGEQIVDSDWVADDYTMALTKTKNGSKIFVYADNGILSGSWKLDKTYDKLKLFYLGGEWRAVVSGYDGVKKSTRVAIYNLHGALKNSFSFSGAIGDYSLDSLGNFWSARVASGKLTLNKYDFTGLKLQTVVGSPAKSVERLIIKKVWRGGGEQAVAAIGDSAGSSLVTLDLDSGSFSREAYPKSAVSSRFTADDYNHDGLYDILRYQLTGGEFKVATGKGVVLKTVVLPKLL
ncbi:MAG: S8 family peptidase [Patescibacteria group bacterium]